MVEPKRLVYLDNLRWSMIVLAVMVHAAVTYGPIGSWFYRDRSVVDPLSDILLTLFPTFAQAFFMGLLFFLAGYFVPSSLDRKGPRRFLADRAWRLGLPTLLFMLAIAPPMVYLLYMQGTDFIGFYLTYLVNPLRWDSGPLWFAVALLLFTVIYTAGRRIGAFQHGIGLGKRSLVALVVLLVLSTFLVRLVFPIGTSVWNMQLCFFPQYAAMFLLGASIGIQGSVERIDRPLARPWMRVGLALSALLLPAALALGGAADGNFDAYSGGLTWQAAALVAWEQVFGFSMIVGLVAIYRDRFDIRSKWAGLLADNAFAMYVFHAPVLVGIAVLLSTTALPGAAKFAALAGAGLLLTLLLAHTVLRRVPGLKAVL